MSIIEQKMQTVLVQQKMNTVDEEGKLRKFDIREDPEQRAKCEQTMELLLAAGYFRVRIKGLSEFDKIVGGLAWSIQACNFTVDIDLLYRESAQLGQKIALTERIVLVLSRMKCPHAIEPHQIQGGDFIHIFPVVQWLVTRLLERRAEIGDFNRAYAISQYEKEFHISSSSSNIDSSLKENIAAIRTRHQPKRRYRCLKPSKKQWVTNVDQRQKRVQSTLIEFGQVNQLLHSSETSVDQDKSSVDPNALIKSVVNDRSKVATQIVHSLVNQQQDTLRGIIDDFEEKEKARLEEALTTESGQQQLAIRTFKFQLTKQLESIENLQRNIEQQKSQRDEKKNIALQLKEQLEQLQEELKQIEIETEKIDPTTLQRVEELVSIYETVKKEEHDKRSTYKNAKHQLEEEIAQLKERIENSTELNDEDQQKLNQLEEQYKKVVERFQSQRLVLAQKNREISAISRRLDDIPSAIELAQYRQAFFQLYNQSAVLYRQTKQNYTLYNTFTDMIDYMNKEINLLESIYQGYPQAISTNHGKENFLKQMESIVEGVRQSRLKIEKRQQEEKSKRDALNIQLSQLVEKARQYAKVFKDFQEAIREHEQLTNKSVKNDGED